MKISFRRITSSGSFIPEIDGLRFIAITSVVLFHLSAFLVAKDPNTYSDHINYSLLTSLLSHGHLGVPLFFTISGFILGIPFAKYYIAGEERVNLKKYFLRRLTRLEPPYILAMTLLLFAAVFVAKTLSFDDGIASYFASVFYMHNIIFPGTMPKLNVVAWSLEVEIQFYLLAPVLALLFSIQPASKRRMIILAVAILFTLTNNYDLFSLPFISLLNYIQYFLIGFLLADLYVSRETLFRKTKFDHWIALFFLVIIWLFDGEDWKTQSQRFIWECAFLTSIFFLYYYVLFMQVFKFLSLRAITNIGGMCYSIYLLHYPVISLIGNPLVGISFSKYSFVNGSVYSLIILLFVLLISGIYFLLIERPCMDKNWYKKIFKHKPQPEQHH